MTKKDYSGNSVVYRVNAVPAPRLMRTIGATALGPTEAVAELVANSIDARIGDEIVTIDVKLHETRIEIADDASGIALEVLKEALRLGVDMDSKRPTRQGRMGTYGLGMKTAAASLGDKWGVTTRPLGMSGKEYRATFDLNEWESRESSSDDWIINIHESNSTKGGDLGDRNHGTIIWIEQLRVNGQLPGPYLSHLTRAFAPFIKQGHVIRVNNQVAKPAKPRLVDGSYQEFTRVIHEEKNWVIRGWVGLDTQTHNDGFYGIDLFKNNQLIEQYNQDFFKSHLMTSRILGEAHLDFVPVNFNKVDFTRGTPEWELAKTEMTSILRPLAKASREMSRNRKDESRTVKAVAKLQEAFRGPVGQIKLTSAERPLVSTDSKVGQDSNEVGAVERELKAIGRNIQLPTSLVKMDAQINQLTSVHTPWDYIYDKTAKELQVVINSESATFVKMNDVDFLACIAVSDCISRFLIEVENVNPKIARRVSNEWLHEAVTGEPVWNLQDHVSQGGGKS